MRKKWIRSARNQSGHGKAGTRMLSWFALFLFLMFAAVMPARAAAEATAQPEGWQFGADIYLWAAGMGGETAGGDTIDVPFDKILKNLDFAYKGAFHARNGR
jgi:hypothetical protein